MKLYDIAESFKVIEQFLNEAETDDEIVRFKTALTELEGAFEEKVENIVYLIRNIESDVEVLRNEEKRLKTKREIAERKIENLKEFLFGAFKYTETEKIKYPQFTVSIRKNPVSVEVVDETKIPIEFFVKQPDKLNKTELKEALKNGLEIQGATLVSKESLQIR